METQTSAHPRISVVMATHNHGTLLLAAVRSALAQTVRELEVVLVDNGCTDGSVERLRAEVTDPRLRLLRFPENRGIAAGLNAAIAEARGEWVAIADSDDLLHPQRLELQLAALEADPSLDVVSCDVEMMDLEGKPLGRMTYCHTPEEAKAYAAFNMPVAHVGVFARREVLRRYPYREELTAVADLDMLMRLTEQHRVAALPIPLYRWRRHGGSISYAQPMRMEAYTCVARVATARRRAGQPERLTKLAEMAAALHAEGAPLGLVYRRFARLCAHEGWHVLACLHAALALRHGGGVPAFCRYASSLMCALLGEPRSLAMALSSTGKAPFWMLLKRAGFPGFPRY